jgi:hypothetical protein
MNDVLYKLNNGLANTITAADIDAFLSANADQLFITQVKTTFITPQNQL